MKKKLIKLIKKTNIIQTLIKTLFYISSALPIKKNTVVFESFHGKQFSDNPKAIYEYMNQHLQEYKLYWSFDRSGYAKYKDKNIRSILRLGIRWIFIMARAEYWVTNSRLPIWLPKRKGTTYIQTWHGTPLKKLGLDIDNIHMPGTTTKDYKRNFAYESSKWDYLITPNRYSTKIFKRAFNYNKKVVESGYPRNDVLINCNNEEDIKLKKRALGIPLHKKVILYAPTWRDNDYYSVGKYKLNLQLDLNLMQKKLSDDYIILLRAHYLVAENIDLTSYKDFIYDYSSYGDISHLYLVSDILITDYSSVFFDYANLNRPILFFVPDIEQYRDKLRGFYLDFEKAVPGPLVETTVELIHEIMDIEMNSFQTVHSYSTFRKKFCYLEDGKSSERVVKSIFM